MEGPVRVDAVEKVGDERGMALYLSFDGQLSPRLFIAPVEEGRLTVPTRARGN
jgi:hypothetical protein